MYSMKAKKPRRKVTDGKKLGRNEGGNRKWKLFLGKSLTFAIRVKVKNESGLAKFPEHPGLISYRLFGTYGLLYPPETQG